MKFTGVTYRPPFEAGSLLLQVTQGCSHNACSFCTMYRDVPFRMESLEQIETDLIEAAAYVPDCRRVFLENGDPFVLGADKLIQIAELIHRYLPKIETIAMYASIKNIQSLISFSQERSMPILAARSMRSYRLAHFQRIHLKNIWKKNGFSFLFWIFRDAYTSGFIHPMWYRCRDI